MRLSGTALAALLFVTTTACSTTTRTHVPFERASFRLRVPSQQRLLSESVEEAVSHLDFAPLVGRTAYVEVNGVFPHAREDFLNFVQSAVEGRLSSQGVIVRPLELAMLQPLSDGAAGFGIGVPTHATPQDSTLGAQPVPIRVRPETDFRVVVGVARGGVDRIARGQIDTTRAVAEGSLLGGGALLMGAGAAVSSDGAAGTVLMSVGGLALISGAVALLVAPPRRYHERLIGTVRLDVAIIPSASGAGRVLTAEGHSEVVADPDLDESAVIE